MHSVLRPFSNILSPGKLQVPAGGMTIDWEHPLSRGLIGCWLPGVMGGNDITGSGPFLATRANTQFGVSQEGPSLLAANASGADGLIANAFPAFKAAAGNLSMYWRGMIIGADTTNQNAGIFGISYTNAATSPYFILGMYGNNYPKIGVAWNAGGAFVNRPGSANANISNVVTAYNKMYSFGLATDFSVSSTAVYSYGIALDTFTAGAAQPTAATSRVYIGANDWDAGTSNSLCNIFCIWNRVLSADEMAWLNIEPYSFLVPAEYEMPVAFLPAAPSFNKGGFFAVF